MENLQHLEASIAIATNVDSKHIAFSNLHGTGKASDFAIFLERYFSKQTVSNDRRIETFRFCHCDEKKWKRQNRLPIPSETLPSGILAELFSF
ncbi:MAG: hypothetical protein PHS97_02040 [Oscillospiraceae bacterium]|nr:hypothetical protein [Oscillospiraceae bacterium]